MLRLHSVVMEVMSYLVVIILINLHPGCGANYNCYLCHFGRLLADYYLVCHFLISLQSCYVYYLPKIKSSFIGY